MISGRHEPGFEPLARAFQDVLTSPPFGGAALTLYLDGRPVFDMWGGPRDNEGNGWEERTSSVSFSTTKGVASTALHIAADRGLLRYDDPVAKYWPEFAQNGKHGVTVRNVLNHSAGMYDAFNVFEHADDLLDWDKSIAALARAKPAHEPGRYHAYHALTYGYLVGEIVQRATGRPFSRFIDEEIAVPLGLRDFHVGAPEEALTRAAHTFRLPLGPRPVVSREEHVAKRQRQNARMRRVARVLRAFGLPLKLERTRSAFEIRGIGKWDFAAPCVLRACIPSAGGLFTARDLARMYATLAAGGSFNGKLLLSPETVQQMTVVQTRKPDGVMLAPMSWRLGYHGVFSKLGPVRGAYGHFGYNGSGAWASPRHKAALGYVVNAGGGTPLGDLRMIKLTSVALSCVRSRRKH